MLRTASRPPAELRRFDPQRVLIDAWDIGKDVHMHYMRTLAGEVLMPPHKVSSLAEGYRTTREQIRAHLLSGQYDLGIFGHEPTGIYHQSLSHHLATDFHAHLTGALAPSSVTVGSTPPWSKKPDSAPPNAAANQTRSTSLPSPNFWPRAKATPHQASVRLRPSCAWPCVTSRTSSNANAV
ncbi:MAG: hypothetical protein HZY76_02990 [Anaerolineae bacterium]|nr:MAG: hypothetical protein HZY76_02990 [Anaerolineae bacterium]